MRKKAEGTIYIWSLKEDEDIWADALSALPREAQIVDWGHDGDKSTAWIDITLKDMNANILDRIVHILENDFEFDFEMEVTEWERTEKEYYASLKRNEYRYKRSKE